MLRGSTRIANFTEAAEGVQLFEDDGNSQRPWRNSLGRAMQRLSFMPLRHGREPIEDSLRVPWRHFGKLCSVLIRDIGKIRVRSIRYARCMGLVFTDISAIEMYRRNYDGFSGRVVSLPYGKVRGLSAMNPSVAEIRDLGSRGFAYLSHPVCLMVPHAKMRMARDKARCIVHGLTLPDSANAFRRMAPDLFCASPELALLHYASSADIRNAILVGFELCGSYRLDDTFGFVKASPATTSRKLARMAAAMHDVCGAKRFRRVARYVLSGAASPMESALAMLLSLPGSLGGYGLPAPCINYRIDIAAKSKLSHSRRYYVADLYWPSERVAVEYDSDSYHTGSERIAEDAQRRNALLHLGVEVVTVGRRQIMEKSQFDDVARIVGRALGRPIRIRASEWGNRNNELRRIVLPGR